VHHYFVLPKKVALVSCLNIYNHLIVQTRIYFETENGIDIRNLKAQKQCRFFKDKKYHFSKKKNVLPCTQMIPVSYFW